MELAGEDRCRHVSFSELLDLFGRYEPRKAIPKDARSRKDASIRQATNDIGSDPQKACRLPVVEEAFWWRHDVGRRAILAQIFGPEQVTRDPPKLFRISGRHKTTINDSPDDSGKPFATTEVVLHGMAQCYELARLRVCLHRHRVSCKGGLDLHDVFAKEEETPGGEIALGPFHEADSSGGGDRDESEVL